MNTIIYTQLLGIWKSKRLLVTILFAPAFLLFCSYYAINSWLPVELVLAMFAALVSMLSSEILHWLTIDEIKDGLFDIILVSPFPRFIMLLSKVIFPIVCGTTLSVVSLIINNFLFSYGHFSYWNFSFASFVFLFFVATFSALLEFISLLIIRKRDMNIHFFLLSGSIFLMIWVYNLISKNLVLFYFAIIFLVILSIFSALFLMSRRYQIIMKGSEYFFSTLYGDNKISMFGAFFRKNFSIIRCRKAIFIQSVIAVMSPMLLGEFEHTQDLPYIDLIVALLLAAIPSVINIYIVFYSTLSENRNKVNEILQIQNVTATKRGLEKAASAGIISSVLCILSFLLSMFFYEYDLYIIVLTIINCFISAIICSFYSRRISSFRLENIHKTVISLISILFQSIILLFI